MKTFFSYCLVSLFFWGCASLTDRSENIESSAYIKGRVFDLADIFSFTLVFNSYGARVAIGPTGAGFQIDGIVIAPTKEMGLRMGVIGSSFCYGYTPLITIFDKCEADYGSEERQIVEERNKSYSITMWDEEAIKGNPAVIGRLGFSAGFIIGFRVEVNPLEAIDFLVGLFGFDPMNDDMHKKDARSGGLLSFLNALRIKDNARAKKIIDLGLDVNEQNWGHDKKENGDTLLMEAISYNNLEIAGYLLEKNADPNKKNKKGENAITSCNTPEKLEFVLKKTKIPITTETLGQAIAFIAKSKIHSPYIPENTAIILIKMLIEKGGDVNFNYGRPLFNAYKQKSFLLLENLVLVHKAKTNYIYDIHEEGFYKIPLVYDAVRQQQYEEAKLLIRLGFDSNLAEEFEIKQTPLMIMSSNCSNIEHVRFFLQNGANKNLKDVHGKTAYDRINTYMVQKQDSPECTEMRKLLK